MVKQKSVKWKNWLNRKSQLNRKNGYNGKIG